MAAVDGGESRNKKITGIPFFVVDRPKSLELLEYCEISRQNGVFGLMGHANTSKSFQNLFRGFDCDNIIKAVDSGVFSKEGCSWDYEDLFKIYERMGAEYGIMIDFLKEKDKTVKSAAKAMKVYKKSERPFKLVGVAQGNTLAEYLQCYEELKSIGFDHIAIGGLLKKNVNSARYVKVRDEYFLRDVLEAIRKEHKEDWLFLLGCYHPKRQGLFKEFNVFGGDYKGWILNYRTSEKWIEDLNSELTSFENEIEDVELKNLLKYREKINQRLKERRKSKTSKQKDEAKLRSLDKKVMELRKKIAPTLDEEYASKLHTFEKLIYMNSEEKRDYRFKQIRAYLDNNVLSLFRSNLLIISCSQRKKDASNPAPAIDLYDGSVFRMIRKMKRTGNFPKNIHILILSAKYGLLGPYDLIEKYDQLMTEKRAEELKQTVIKDLNKFLSERAFEDIFINMGENYCLVLDGTKFKIQPTHAEGKIGKRLAQTRNWISKIFEEESDGHTG